MSETEPDFPLFPLGMVALPNEIVPLHIFEERYKTMIGECLEAEREFGIVWASDEGLRPVGCACAITQVLETAEDGRMNILTQGTRPFRVVERLEHLPYPAGEIEFLSDKAEDPDAESVADAHAAYSDLVEAATDNRPEPDDLDGLTAYAMAATVDFGPDAKQGLLDLRSENARLRLVARLLRAAMKRIEQVSDAEEVARSNGKVSFG